jgi:hypothetical protein
MRKIAMIGAVLAAGTAINPIPDPPKEPPKREPPPPGSEGIPDRVSLEEDSPFYFPHWKHLGVRIDGQESECVVEFCVSEGWARTQIFWRGQPKMERGKFVTVKRWRSIEPYWRSKP